MKKCILTLVSALAFLSVNAQVQNKISVNLFSIPVRTFNIAYERQMNNNIGLQMTAYYLFGYNTDWVDESGNNNTTKSSGWGVIPEFRFYPMGNGIKGFYIGPHVRYRHFDFSTEETQTLSGARNTYESNLNQIGGGVVVGGQWHFGNAVNFDIYGGPGFTTNSFSYVGTANSTDFDSGRLNAGSFYFRSGVRLGYSF